MDRFTHYEWPFFEERHRQLAHEAESWSSRNLKETRNENPDAICKHLVKALGSAGFLNHCGAFASGHGPTITSPSGTIP